MCIMRQKKWSSKYIMHKHCTHTFKRWSRRKLSVPFKLHELGTLTEVVDLHFSHISGN